MSIFGVLASDDLQNVDGTNRDDTLLINKDANVVMAFAHFLVVVSDLSTMVY